MRGANLSPYPPKGKRGGRGGKSRRSSHSSAGVLRAEYKAASGTTTTVPTERELALTLAPSKSTLSKAVADFTDMEGRLWYDVATKTPGPWAAKIEERMRQEPLGRVAFWVRLPSNTNATDEKSGAPHENTVIRSVLGTTRLVVHETVFSRGRSGRATGLAICSRLMAPPPSIPRLRIAPTTTVSPPPPPRIATEQKL